MLIRRGKRVDIVNYDTRQEFNESWLMEFPQVVNAQPTWEMLKSELSSKIQHNSPIDCSNGYKKIMNSTLCWYWHETDNIVDLIVALIPKAQSLLINMTGKLQEGQPPWMSDAYQFIIDDNKKALTIASDTKLTKSSVNLWKRMVANGYHVSVYNVQNPGSTLRKLETSDQIDQFADSSMSKQSWRFLLSEDSSWNDVCDYFTVRRMRELTNML